VVKLRLVASPYRNLMLESDDSFFALQQLDNVVRTSRPLVFWVGAGASAWCGYKLWGELATRLHEEFVTAEPSYDRDRGAQLIQDRLYPRFFSLARATRTERYVSFLKSELAPRSSSPEYDRFLRALLRYSPLRIITTNLDERLEQHLPDCAVVQRADIAHAIAMLNGNNSFVLKLHGSISAVETAVLTEEDYGRLSEDETTCGC
jgi:NAD-dependent SIR2 family protein deacetylase